MKKIAFLILTLGLTTNAIPEEVMDKPVNMTAASRPTIEEALNMILEQFGSSKENIRELAIYSRNAYKTIMNFTLDFFDAEDCKLLNAFQVKWYKSLSNPSQLLLDAQGIDELFTRLGDLDITTISPSLFTALINYTNNPFNLDLIKKAYSLLLRDLILIDNELKLDPLNEQLQLKLHNLRQLSAIISITIGIQIRIALCAADVWFA